MKGFLKVNEPSLVTYRSIIRTSLLAPDYLIKYSYICKAYS
jgi:hypothetical protein